MAHPNITERQSEVEKLFKAGIPQKRFIKPLAMKFKCSIFAIYGDLACLKAKTPPKIPTKRKCLLVANEVLIENFLLLNNRLTDVYEVKYGDGFIHSFIGLPAVYFLFKDESLIYIGKTANHVVRMGNHKLDKDFNFIYFILLNGKRENNLLEEMAIRHFLPPLNKQHNKNYRLKKKF